MVGKIMQFMRYFTYVLVCVF